MESHRAIESQGSIFDTFEARLRVPSNLAFTYFIKYQYIGVPGDGLDDLFWNFEYLTPGPFGRLLSDDFAKTKMCRAAHALAMRTFGP